MCNRYSLVSGQEAIRNLTDTMDDLTGNLPLMPAIYPDVLPQSAQRNVATIGSMQKCQQHPKQSSASNIYRTAELPDGQLDRTS